MWNTKCGDYLVRVDQVIMYLDGCTREQARQKFKNIRTNCKEFTDGGDVLVAVQNGKLTHKRYKLPKVARQAPIVLTLDGLDFMLKNFMFGNDKERFLKDIKQFSAVQAVLGKRSGGLNMESAGASKRPRITNDPELSMQLVTFQQQNMGMIQSYSAETTAAIAGVTRALEYGAKSSQETKEAVEKTAKAAEKATEVVQTVASKFDGVARDILEHGAMNLHMARKYEHVQTQNIEKQDGRIGSQQYIIKQLNLQKDELTGIIISRLPVIDSELVQIKQNQAELKQGQEEIKQGQAELKTLFEQLVATFAA